MEKEKSIKTLNEIFGAETSKVSKNSQMTKRKLTVSEVLYVISEPTF